MTQAAAIVLDAREVLAADAELQEPFIAPRLLRFCHRRAGGDVQRARDAMADAIVLTLAGEGWHRWSHDGASKPAESLLLHLFNVAKDVLKKERERAATWREVEGDPKREAAAADPGPAPGEVPIEWANEDEQMRAAEAVMESLDEDARQMLRVESESDEELGAAELAAKLGWTAKQVYRARERVAYHRNLVLERMKKRGGGR